jgi:hypothetical protein
MKEFTVEIVTKHPNEVVVAGRCGNSPIRVGDVFTKIYAYTPILTMENYGRPRERINEESVQLKIDRIFTYGHFLDEIHPGLTAELFLVGEGDELLQVGKVLAADD